MDVDYCPVCGEGEVRYTGEGEDGKPMYICDACTASFVIYGEEDDVYL